MWEVLSKKTVWDPTQQITARFVCFKGSSLIQVIQILEVARVLNSLEREIPVGTSHLNWLVC